MKTFMQFQGKMPIEKSKTGLLEIHRNQFNNSVQPSNYKKRKELSSSMTTITLSPYINYSQSQKMLSKSKKKINKVFLSFFCISSWPVLSAKLSLLLLLLMMVMMRFVPLCKPLNHLTWVTHNRLNTHLHRETYTLRMWWLSLME